MQRNTKTNVNRIPLHRFQWNEFTIPISKQARSNIYLNFRNFNFNWNTLFQHFFPPQKYTYYYNVLMWWKTQVYLYLNKKNKDGIWDNLDYRHLFSCFRIIGDELFIMVCKRRRFDWMNRVFFWTAIRRFYFKKRRSSNQYFYNLKHWQRTKPSTMMKKNKPYLWVVTLKYKHSYSDTYARWLENSFQPID